MSFQTSNIPNNSDELQCRTEELKNLLILWRHILLQINNLLEWEHKYHPLIIFGSLTFIFIFIHQINPPILTLISCLIIIYELIDLLLPISISIIFKNKDWTSIDDTKYSKLCERIAYFEQQIKYKYQSALKIRQERPIIYLIAGSIVLIFISICSQRIDNFLLIYFTTLFICLTPGIYQLQLIQLIRQYVNDFWNNKTKIQ